MQLPQKQKNFSQFSYPFLKYRLRFEYFQKKKMTVLADVFPKLRTPKNLANQISKKSPFRAPFGKQHVRGTKHCCNLNHTTSTELIDHCEVNWVGENIS